MAELVVNNFSLDLPPDFVLRMVRNNSLLMDESLEGDFSYPIQLPATDRNRTFFSFFDLPESTSQQAVLKCEYIENGITLIRGNIYVKKATRNQYDCFILSGLSKLAEIKEMLIGELEYGGLRSIEGMFQVASYFLTAPNGSGHVEFAFGQFAIANIDVIWTTDANTTLNLVRTEILALAPTKYPGLIIDVVVTGNKITVTAQWSGGYPKLWAAPVSGTWTLDELEIGAPVTAKVLEDHMNDVMASPDNFDYLFPVVYNLESGLIDYAVAGAPVPFEHVWVNYYYDGSFRTELKEGPTSNQITVQVPVTPFPRAIYLLKEILKAGDYKPFGTVLNDENLFNLLLYTSHSLHRGDLSSYWDHNQYVLKFKIGELLPKITVNDYLQALRKLFGLHFFFNDAKAECYVEFFEDIVSSTEFIDWSQKVASKPQVTAAEPTGYVFRFENDTNDQFIDELVQEIEQFERLPDVGNYTDLYPAPGGLEATATNQIVLVTHERAFYRPVFSSPGVFSNWEFHSFHFHEYKAGDGKTEINPGAGTLTLHRGPISPGAPIQWLVPQVKQPLNQINDPEGYHEFLLRFFFYRGFVYTDDLPKDYPFASFNELDFFRHSIPGADYVLCWETSKGLYEQFWKKYTQWRDNAKEIEYLIELSPLDYINLDMRKKVQINGVNYFIKKIDVSFPIIGPARVTFLKA
jgi:hypothetical protein